MSNENNDIDITKFDVISKESIDNLKNNLPTKFSKQLTSEVVKIIDNMTKDSNMNESDATTSILENLIYIKDIKGVTFERYCVALRFVSMVLNGVTAVDAWKTIYPEKSDGRYTQERMTRWAGAYANTKLVSALKARMMVSFSIQYSHFRHAAIRKEFDLMNGVASISKVPMYEKNSMGKTKLDKDGQKILLRDNNGDIMFTDVYQVVTPMVQHQAAQAILEITKPKEESDIDISVAISVEERENKAVMRNTMAEIAKAQRDRLIAGESIDAIQNIGSIIEANLVDSEDDDDE